MAYISGTIAEDAKIIVLDSNHNKIISKDLTLDSYTKLLLHFDEAPLADSSSAPKVLTLNGGMVRSSGQSKFGGYSGYFDGSDDYISIADAADWNFGSGDFTIDFWINQNGSDGGTVFATNAESGLGAWNQHGILLNIYTDRTLHLYASTNTFWDILSDWSPGAASTGWAHIAIVRNGNTLYVYNNGVLLSSTAFNGAIRDGSTGLGVLIGRQSGGGNYVGYIDELRISKGVARWTSNFTPPTTPYKTPAPGGSYRINDLSTTSGTIIAMANSGEVVGYQVMGYISDVDSYTKLLLHFNESPLVDTMGKTLTLNGGVARSATQSKFGGYAGSFNGTNQYISVPDSEDWNFGSGNFTIDMWANFNSLADHIKLFSHGVQGDGNDGIDVSLFNSSGLSMAIAFQGSYIIDFSQGSTSGWSTGQWYHIAVIRNGNVWSLYRNGILLASQTAAVSYPNVGGNVLIGRAYYNTVHYMNGYIDEYRISKGIARWTANFTPPISAYI